MSDRIYQLKITLKGSKPPIWRRVLVKDSLTLEDLHRVIQKLMDWEDYHLHEFMIEEESYRIPDPEEDKFWDEEFEDETKVLLKDAVKRKGTKFYYTYDFGDGWDHEILLEKISQPEPNVHYPFCITGKRNAPPEDSGGIWGYEIKLETMKNPRHPDHEEITEWMGKDFDPELFDIESINKKLEKL